MDEKGKKELFPEKNRVELYNSHDYWCQYV